MLSVMSRAQSVCTVRWALGTGTVHCAYRYEDPNMSPSVCMRLETASFQLKSTVNRYRCV
jgi:hypothetical protein